MTKKLYKILGIVLITLILSAGLNAYLYGKTSQNKKTEKIIIVNSTSIITNSGLDNYIQAPHVNFDFTYNSGIITLKDVYTAKIDGMSMQPTIFSDNYLIQKRFKGNIRDLKEGMIVSFQRQGDSTTLTHRIKGIYPSSNKILLQGDHWIGTEEVTPSQIKFIVIGVLFK